MGMQKKLTKIEQNRIEEKTELMNIIINLKDYQHKMTKKFNGKIAFLNRIIKTNNIYTKYLTTKEEMSMEIENQISDDDISYFILGIFCNNLIFITYSNSNTRFFRYFILPE
jgi:hypothetical protein